MAVSEEEGEEDGLTVGVGEGDGACMVAYKSHSSIDTCVSPFAWMFIATRRKYV